MTTSTAISFANASLPAVATLSTALRNIQNEVGTGDVILKMDKTGSWIYGADATDIEEGSRWAINPFSFIHGYVAWGEGDKLGEKMVPMSQPLPEVGEGPAGAKRGWEQQLGFSLRCINGEDEGLEVVFRVSSVGGKRAVQKLGVAIADQVDAEQSKGAAAKIVPICELGKDHYQHKSYGKVFTPEITIVEWVTMAGPAEATAAVEPSKVEAPAEEAANEEPVRRRRRG